MQSLNKIEIRGYATKDMIVREGRSGEFSTFSLAVDRGKKKDGTDLGVDFFNVFVSGKQTGWIDVRKGDLVQVNGSLRFKQDEKYGTQATLFADLFGGVTNFSDWARFKSGQGTASPGGQPEDDEDIPF